MKAYVILEGEYSDRHVVGVTLDREMVTKILDTHKWWDCEEYETDTFALMGEGNKLFIVCKEDGKYTAREEVNNIGYYLGDVGKLEFYKKNRWKNDRYFFTVMANDKDHAIKATQDKIAEYEAMRQGV